MAQQPIKVMLIFGTRPEAIKMAPVVQRLREDERFQPIVVVTAQHREMLDQVLTIFHIKPDYDLNIMRAGQTLTGITVHVVSQLDAIIQQEQPRLILVHGDTTTTFAASVSAFYHQVAIGHVEAGLRTWDKYSPYPEEMNRQLTDVLSDLYFAPTTTSRDNLLKENHPASQIFVTGNTAIDALGETVTQNYHHEVLDKIPAGHKFILLTMHRRENQGEPMRATFRAIKRVVDERQNLDVVYPVHLSPNVQEAAHEVFADDERIHLIEPLDVVDFHNLAAKALFIMTDSGGVQEEAPSLGKPVLVLRETTERPEGVTAGTLKLVGTNEENVYTAMTNLLTNQAEYEAMASAKNPYGDGHASERIADAIATYFKA
ncbi:non-hydrolyzing UDP-N-acetylglucosamine 2-epimerase [Furfurilactobacillus milii]|uniref:UDP-N-acetylglucosamine 2-epimerase (non-hydrolyzing) n=1 Tax=Furfurilactobacillus rossiae TaxID=231049 RepID=A0A7C9ITV1_9LACO|nr:UDP-N-acetylglucosamine 2-epimerase (non-hydrolyzing) [Furfurilactobacillus milii]MYV05876.1 UDP-N-acetylglucosamine 2-epimerase (non-hydrolyzing) [Furfurilactobacillus milii]